MIKFATVIAAVALTATTVHAQAPGVMVNKYASICPMISSYARTVMEARQAGVGMGALMTLAFRMSDPNVRATSVHVISRAYDGVRFSSQTMRIQATYDFATDIARECYAVSEK